MPRRAEPVASRERRPSATGEAAAPRPAEAPDFVAPIDYRDSVAAYIDPAHDRVARWGDYSTATSDPAHANGFYISNEFDNGTVSHYSSWGTSVDHILV